MGSGIHNYSEIGKLNKVLLHRIGTEIEGLVPDNFARLLFDDIPYIKIAQEEHDGFANLLRSNGVEVVYYVDETAKALVNPQVKEEFLKLFIKESNLNSPAAEEAIFDYLNAMETKEMVAKIIAGVKKTKYRPSNPNPLLTTFHPAIHSTWTLCQTCISPETRGHASVMESAFIT